MATFGFKLSKIELYRNQGRIPFDFGNVDGKHYLDLLMADFERWKSARNAQEKDDDDHDVVDEPENASDQAESTAPAERTDLTTVLEESSESGETGAAALRTPVVRLEEMTRYNGAVLLHVRYGLEGDHDKAVHPQGLKKDQDLKGLATTRLYRALLIAPPAGEVALLAVEVIGRSHPANNLPRRLRNLNPDAIGPRLAGNVADDVAVRQLVKNGEASHVELYKYAPSAQGGPPRIKDIVLSVKLGGKDGQAKRVLDRVAKWLPNSGTSDGADGSMTPSGEAQAVAAIVWEAAKDLPFDDARVSVKSGARRRGLRPLDSAEGFIYDSGDNPLSDDEFVEEVAAATQKLFESLGIDMDDDWALAPDERDG